MNALLFPGQGSQFVGMARDLYETFKASRSVLDRADEVLGFPLTELMFSGPADVLQETRNAQPAILAHSIAAWDRPPRPIDLRVTLLRASTSGRAPPSSARS